MAKIDNMDKFRDELFAFRDMAHAVDIYTTHGMNKIIEALDFIKSTSFEIEDAQDDQ